MKLNETTLESTRKYDGKIIKLDVDKVELADGKVTIRECIRHSGGAAVLYIRDGKVALVKQFRYPYKQVIYEIPAGKIDKGEEPENTARRELEEETGYSAEDLTFMFKTYPTPGYTDEIIYVYFCGSARFTRKHPDEGEFVNLEFVPLKQVFKMCQNGEICDAKTLIAVFKYAAENNIHID